MNPNILEVNGVAPDSELSYALAFVHTAVDKVRTCPTEKGMDWYTWTGARWAPDNQHAEAKNHYMAMTQNLEAITAQALARIQGNRVMENILALAAIQPGLRVRAEDFDARPYELNTPGGIVDLRTGRLFPPDPSHLHTKMTAVAPAETWAGSSWDGFIRQVLPEQAVRDYLQELAGVALVGEVLAQVFVFAYGHGANGKSVFFDVIGELLGDYAGTVGSQAVMSGNMQQKELIYGRFVGKRLVVMQELNEGDQMDEATVKALTGGDRLDARTLYQQGGNSKPQHSLFMAGNHMPALPSGGGESIWRRMKVIHFGVQVPPEQQDPLLKEKLLEDGPCVLAWLVEGCRRFLERGRLPVDPVPVAEATRRYRLAADPFAAFMAGALLFEPGAAVMVSQVREAFGEYVGALGLAGTEWKNNEYPRRLRNAGAETFKSGSQRGYRGLAVRPHSEWDYHEE